MRNINILTKKDLRELIKTDLKPLFRKVGIIEERLRQMENKINDNVCLLRDAYKK